MINWFKNKYRKWRLRRYNKKELRHFSLWLEGKVVDEEYDEILEIFDPRPVHYIGGEEMYWRRRLGLLK